MDILGKRKQELIDRLNAKKKQQEEEELAKKNAKKALPLPWQPSSPVRPFTAAKDSSLDSGSRSGRLMPGSKAFDISDSDFRYSFFVIIF